MREYDQLVHVVFSGAQKYCAIRTNAKTGETYEFHQKKGEEERFENRYYIPEDRICMSTVANIVRYMTGQMPIPRFRDIGLKWDNLSKSTAKLSVINLSSISEEFKTRTMGKEECWDKGAKTFLFLDGKLRLSLSGPITQTRIRLFLSDKEGLWEAFTAIANKYDPDGMKRGNMQSVIETLNKEKNSKDIANFTALLRNSKKKPLSNIINCELDDNGNILSANGMKQWKHNPRVARYSYRDVNKVISLAGEIIFPASNDTIQLIYDNFPGAGTILEGGFYYISYFEEYHKDYLLTGTAPYPYNFK